MSITAVRRNKGRPLITIAGVADAEAAEAYTTAELLIARADVVLAEGEYLDDDLIACHVVDAAGADRGRVVDVLHYPAQDFLVVGPAKALVPLVSAFIRVVDIAGKTIHVDVPPGLLDGDATEA